MEIDQDGCKLIKKNKIKSKHSITPSSTNSGIFKADETKKNVEITREKSIKLMTKVENELDHNVEQLQEILLEQHSKLKKKKKKKKRRIEPESTEDSSCEDCEEVKEPTKKKKKFQPKNEEYKPGVQQKNEYKPGMLSDLLQVKKYGRVIIPWDPSFGLDKRYSGNTRREEDGCTKHTLKINPLFDLSKRIIAPLTDEAGSDKSTFFVGNLPSNTRIMELKKLFSKHGLIYKVKLKKKTLRTPKASNENGSIATGSETVNAIIKFKTLKSSEAVLNMNGTLYKDHHLRVTLSKDDPNFAKERSIFVGNLAFNAQDDVLWKAFEDCGEIESVRIIRDDRSGKGRGFGYVNFKSANSVKAALELDGQLVLNRELRVMSNSSRAVSLSNMITVKRKRIQKKRKSSTTDENSTATVKKLKKIKNDDAQSELLTSRETDSNVEKKMKKKRKKKKKKDID